MQLVPAIMVSAPKHRCPTRNVTQFQPMSRKENAGLVQAVPEMIRDLVRRAEAKLAELEGRKQYLRRRLQALRFLATHATETRPAERQENLAPGPSPSEHAIERTASDHDSAKGTPGLRRACRIALMESDEPQTTEQIYQRICKRGSLSFQSSMDALHILSAELELMAKESEITCLVLHGEKRWQRPFCE
jgi:hypothetical protein